MYRVVDNKGSAKQNSLAQLNLLCNPHNMACTKQKRSNDPKEAVVNTRSPPSGHLDIRRML